MAERVAQNSIISQTGDGYFLAICKKTVEQNSSFVTGYPELVAEWNYEKNFPVKPDNVKRGSHDKVWWKCSRGHEWQATVNNRTSKHTGCPICANRVVLEGFNDLKTIRPDIAEEWDYEDNNPLLPTQVTIGSEKKVWWKCKNGHVWQTAVYNRTRDKKTGCPYCYAYRRHRILSCGSDD